MTKRNLVMGDHMGADHHDYSHKDFDNETFPNIDAKGMLDE